MSTASEEDDKFMSEGHSNGSLSGSEDVISGDEYDDDDDDGDGDEDGVEDTFPPPLLQHNFAPPFYGRPPTPLPPSPSLTSLLRPSRPTTPDASDDELEPVPRASPKVPTYEYYGFVLYLFSSLTFLMYLLWSYLPSPFLHALGIYYYPNRWWSLAIPSFLVMTIVYIYVALAAYNTEILTLPLSAVETVVDDAAKVAVIDSRGRIRGMVGSSSSASSAATAAAAASAASAARKGNLRRKDGGGSGRSRGASGRGHAGSVNGGGPSKVDWRTVWNEGTDAVMDVPLAGVCEVLYGEGKDSEDELQWVG